MGPIHKNRGRKSFSGDNMRKRLHLLLLNNIGWDVVYQSLPLRRTREFPCRSFSSANIYSKHHGLAFCIVGDEVEQNLRVLVTFCYGMKDQIVDVITCESS